MSGELREAIALAIYASDFGDIGDWDEERNTFQGEYRANADAVLALPEIAALRAKAAGADRVREVAEELDADSRAAQVRAEAMDRTDENVRRHTAERRHARVAHHAASTIRAALDGPPC